MLRSCRHRQLLPIVVAVAACHSVQSLDMPEPNGELEGSPQAVSVTRQDQTVLTIYRPTVKGDSLIGRLDKPTSTEDVLNARRVAVGLLEIREISVRRLDATMTAFGLLGSAIAGFALFVLLFIATFSEGT